MSQATIQIVSNFCKTGDVEPLTRLAAPVADTSELLNAYHKFEWNPTRLNKIAMNAAAHKFLREIFKKDPLLLRKLTSAGLIIFDHAAEDEN